MGATFVYVILDFHQPDVISIKNSVAPKLPNYCFYLMVKEMYTLFLKNVKVRKVHSPSFPNLVPCN